MSSPKPTLAYSWLSRGRLLPMAERSLKELLKQGKPSRDARAVKVRLTIVEMKSK